MTIYGTVLHSLRKFDAGKACNKLRIRRHKPSQLTRRAKSLQSGVKEIDGVFAAFAGGDTDVTLNAGQEMLVWVSCSYFSMPVEGAYCVTIDKL